MDIMSAAGAGVSSSVAKMAHGLSLTVMKKGMESAEQMALNELHAMLPQKGQFIDVYA